MVKSLEHVWHAKGLREPAGTPRVANSLADYMANALEWKLLGPATSQAALGDAANGANQGLAVIAVRKGSPMGHVALILPSDLFTLDSSGRWNLKVPRAASFFLGELDK